MRQAIHGLLLAGLAFVLGQSLTAGEDFKLEPGFTLLFNGSNLEGWKEKGGASLDGKTEAFKGRFKVDAGSIVIDYKAKGNAVIETAKVFGPDAHIKFEFMAGPECNNDLYFRGHKFDIKKGGVKNLQEGKWQLFEIVSSGNTVEFKCDGETQRVAKVKEEKSPLGLRAEYGVIQCRHVRGK
jgi:hypothetical protein